MYPISSLVAIAFLVTLVMTLITKKFTNQNRMKELKESQKDLQKKMRDAAGNLEKQRKIQQEIMESSFELMKHSFKPLIITLLPLLGIFWFLKNIYGPTSLGEISFLFPKWIWIYIGTSIISSTILRKILKVV